MQADSDNFCGFYERFREFIPQSWTYSENILYQSIFVN